MLPTIKSTTMLVGIILAAVALPGFGQTYSCVYTDKGKKKTESVTLTTFSAGYAEIETLTPLSCQGLINKHWSAWGMEKWAWASWGYNRPCDKDWPLYRTFLAAEFVSARHHLQPTNPNIKLNRFWGAATRWTNHLRPRCSSGKNFLLDHPVDSGLTNIYLRAYRTHAFELAGFLIHEARHEIKPHNGGNKCKNGRSCDQSYEFGGANAWQLNWGWQYGLHAGNSNRMLRSLGIFMAHDLKNRHFVETPKLNIPFSAPKF